MTTDRPDRAADPLPVLWLCGAPGAGKSAVAWEVHRRHGEEQVAHVDIDQLTMLAPGPDDSFALAVASFGSLVDVHRRLGTRALIVSGVIDPEQVPVLEAALHGRAGVTWCLVDAEDDVLHRRIRARGWSEDLVEKVLADARAWRAAAVMHRIDTTSRTAADGAEEAEQHLHLRPAVAPEDLPELESADSGELIVLFGPRAVGKSALSWGLFMDCAGRGEPTGYLDADQLGFLHAEAGLRDRLILSAITALARSFTEAGAVRTLVNGNLSPALIAALSGPRCSLVHLDAPEDVLATRIAARHGDDEARLGGDDLRGASADGRAAALDRARIQREEYARVATSAHALDVSADDPAAHVVALRTILEMPRAVPTGR